MCSSGAGPLLQRASAFQGYNFRLGSIASATAHAQAHGVKKTQFEVGRAQDFASEDYDLVTCFDCLQEMGIGLPPPRIFASR
jgi:2-polyprenyl-3-methyl-5-hydroxy-6-metoxy-1,4-benzoquinol methylase